MVPALAKLDDLQHQAVHHSAGPLLIDGGPGTGKTETLGCRIAWLTTHSEHPQCVLCLTRGTSAARALSDRVDELVDTPHTEPWITTFGGLCERLLHEEALEAGLDPFFCPLTQSDRLVLLLEQADNLSLRHNQIHGNPAPLIAALLPRIDRLKGEMVSHADYRHHAEALVAQANGDAQRAAAAQELEFAKLYQEHDELIAAHGSLDAGDLVIKCFRLLHEKPHVRERVVGRFSHVLVDDYQETSFAQGMLLRLLCQEHGNITATGDPDQAIHRTGGSGHKNFRDFRREYQSVTQITLKRGFRLNGDILRAANAVAEPEGQTPWASAASSDGYVRFWRCESERAQAQAVASDIQTLITDYGVAPESVCILVGSVKSDSPVLCWALEERAIQFRLTGGDAYFKRQEVKDVLAWLRLLDNPDDSSAVVRVLSRPPIELHAVDIARLTQLSRRRKVDMLEAASLACEGPQLSPEGRERVQAFLRLHGGAAEAFDDLQPDAFVHRLIERIGLRRQQLFAAQPDTVHRLINIGKLVELANFYMRRESRKSARDFAHYLTAVAEAGLTEPPIESSDLPGACQIMTVAEAQGRQFDYVFCVGLSAYDLPQTDSEIPQNLIKESLPDSASTLSAHEANARRRLYVAMTRARRGLVLSFAESIDGQKQQPSLLFEQAREAVGISQEVFEQQLFGPSEGLHSVFGMMRDDLLEEVSTLGGRLGELRLDTYLDVSSSVARYLELIKVAGLIERLKAGQTLDDALQELNHLLAQGASQDQRESLLQSPLDDYLQEATQNQKPPTGGDRSYSEPSLEPFIPKRGDGLLLSASDIETYRLCPLKYKFSRVLRIPEEPTISQRFGLVVHQVLERFHATNETPSASLGHMMALFEAAWRRQGFSNRGAELELRAKARSALRAYWEADKKRSSEPLWFERSFSFALGHHLVRGRVDRVDRHPDGSFELIDYKTGVPKTQRDLQNDIQLSLYQMGARDCWGVRTSAQSYYYVLDNEKVFVEHSDQELQRVKQTVKEIAESIQNQRFEPKPSHELCSACDFRLICPAAEK
jgi:DNA helicase II / ATP-dependent DNA helicase PcrA